MATIIESLYLPDLLDGLTLAATARGLSRVHFGESVDVGTQGPLVRKAERQLREFFAGERFVFDVALDLEGTAFQLEVWRALTKIPYAETCSYRDIAITVDRPTRISGNRPGQHAQSNPGHRAVPSRDQRG